MAKVSSANLLRNQLTGERPETLDAVLYDSVLTVVSVTQTLRLFQNNIGAVGINRTNMKNSGSLPGSHNFFVTAIKMYLRNLAGTPFFFAGGAAPTIHPANVIFGSLSFNFVLDPISQYEGTGEQFWDQKDYINDTGTTLGIESNPKSGFKTLRFNNPVVIPANRAFWIDVTLTTPAAGLGYTAAGTPLYCALYGFLRRNK